MPTKYRLNLVDNARTNVNPNVTPTGACKPCLVCVFVSYWCTNKFNLNISSLCSQAHIIRCKLNLYPSYLCYNCQECSGKWIYIVVINKLQFKLNNAHNGGQATNVRII